MRTRQVGDGAHPDAHQHRRPLFHRQPFRRCRCTATRACSSACSTIRTLTSCCSTDYREIGGNVDSDHLIYTGPIDEYFDYRFGKLPYRSPALRARDAEHGAASAGRGRQLSERPVLHAHDRIQAPHGPVHPKTSIALEFPGAEGDPYYPIPRAENAALSSKYEAFADGRRTSPSSDGSRRIATTTWIRSSRRH